ncbi:MAG: ATP-binding protein [Tannerellaceae bacterium]|jgi:predicted ATPase|nr:ATP-binding protein [Tannerellaceae bacterium]
MEAPKEYIRIKNFGPICEVELDPVRPFVVIVGASGSGKSTVMKALALFRWIYKTLTVRSCLYHAGLSKQPLDSLPQTIWEGNGMAKFVRPTTQITYVRGNVEITYANGVLAASRIVPQTELSLEKICFVSERRVTISALPEAQRLEYMDYFPAETLSDFRMAAQSVRDLSLGYLGIRYLAEETPLGMKYCIANAEGEGDEDYKIDLHTASSGIQAVIPLAVIVEYFARHYSFAKRFDPMVTAHNVHIHIEEPELNLYPESQRDLINFIVNRCLVEKHDGYGMTVMMTTHSPYIANHLNLLLMAGMKGKEEDGAFLREEDVDVFEIFGGYLNHLKQPGQVPINTRSMSDPIADIYDRYNELENE